MDRPLERDLLSVPFRIQTNGQTSREMTEPVTKTTNLDRRPDLFYLALPPLSTTNGQTYCERL
jgi:hypothetical protein